MANLCLPKQFRDKLMEAFKNSDISLEKLYSLDSAGRQTIFSQYVGKDLSSFVNAEFERAMLSSQKDALTNWVKKATTMSEPVRRNLLKKIDGIKEVLKPDEELGFLQDLASSKLGMGVTEEEAATVLHLKASIDELKTKWDPKKAAQETGKNAGWESEDARLAYGLGVADFKDYVGKLKLEADTLTLRERLSPKNYGKDLLDAASVIKSTVATLDNSFIGRQGIKTLLNGDYKIWAHTAAESFKNFGKELIAKSPGLFKEKDDSILKAIKADIYSRSNAMNGKYNAAKNGYGLGLLHEEAFPSSAPEKIPVLGRLFKASETAFNGSALMMRADLADAVIAHAEKNGVDMLDQKQATGFGNLVTSMTGRGELGATAPIANAENVLFFAPRFLKANFNTLTAHTFDRLATPEVKAQARMNIIRIAGTVTALLAVAKLINPDSVDFDPRKGRLGKIRIGQHNIDITGGMAGLVTLGSRLFPTEHNGQWGMWSYSQNTHKWTNLLEGGFGKQTALDYIEQFIEGKFSPVGGAIRDALSGSNFDGRKPTFVNTTIGLITPISVQMLTDELQKGNSDILVAMLADSLGFAATDTTMKGYGAKWQKLGDLKGTVVLDHSLKQVTQRFNARAKKLEDSPSFKRMKEADQAKALDAIRSEETNAVFTRYGIK